MFELIARFFFIWDSVGFYFIAMFSYVVYGVLLFYVWSLRFTDSVLVVRRTFKYVVFVVYVVLVFCFHS